MPHHCSSNQMFTDMRENMDTPAIHYLPHISQVLYYNKKTNENPDVFFFQQTRIFIDDISRHCSSIQGIYKSNLSMCPAIKEIYGNTRH